MTQSAPKYINIARPYALAAFQYAQENNAQENDSLRSWKSFLEAAARVANDNAVIKLLANPEIPANKLLDLFTGVLSSITSAAQNNFLHLLAQNKRLVLLPEIADLFNNYVDALEKISNVRLVTAIDVEETYIKHLQEALTKRIHHQVTIERSVNPSILGGAIIHIGDRVIDGSVRGKLNRLLNNLTG